MHLLIDILRNSILITGLVIVMMMMIESINIESKGLVFKGLRKTKIGQVVIAALLGSIPGCMGGFATVSLYTHGLFSFGALVAMMIATSGDEAFMMIAMIPDKALLLFTVIFIIAVVTGILTDIVKDSVHKRKCTRHDHEDCLMENECEEGYIIHNEHEEGKNGTKKAKRRFGWKRISMFIGLALFITALGSGHLSHEHAHDQDNAHTEAAAQEMTTHHEGAVHHEGMEHHEDCQIVDTSGDRHHHSLEINLLSEEWMNVMFAGLSIIVLFVLLLASDHFIEEHLWNHIVRKHLLTIFGWTFGVLLVVNLGLKYIDFGNWISDNTALMILLAALIGFIPESGPHLIFVTLFAAGIVPMPVLLANSISQDGHASIPLLAESKRGFFYAKLINFAVALAAGYSSWLLI